jgi:hypothetical protein
VVLYRNQPEGWMAEIPAFAESNRHTLRRPARRVEWPIDDNSCPFLGKYGSN